MISRFKAWLAPPVFENDPEKTLMAEVLHIVLWTLLVITVGFALLAIVGSTFLVVRLVWLGACAAFLLAAMWVMRAGYVRQVGSVLVVGLWVVFTVALAISEDFVSPGLMGFFLVVMCAGWILGRRAALIWAALSIISSGVVLLGRNRGLLPDPVVDLATPIIWLVFSLIIIAVGLMLYLTRRGLDISLERAFSEVQERRTAEQRLRASEEKYRAFIEHTSEGIYQVEYNPPIPTDLPLEEQSRLLFERGILIECNDALGRMYGYSSGAELIGTQIEVLYGGDAGYQQNLEANLQFFRDGYRSIDIEIEEINDAGEKVYFLNNVIGIVKDGYLIASWGAQRDITPIKQAQAALRKLNIELETRVSERTFELEYANQELKSFASLVSHDLQAPLRAIEGYAVILSHDYAQEWETDAQMCLENIQVSARQMKRLIDDLLRFSRITQQELEKRRVDTTDLVRGVLEDLRPGVQDRQVEIQIGELPACKADPALLRQVLVNLLDNALKYTRTQEVANIEVGWQDLDEGGAYFVKDNGVGFDMKYADKIFGVFERAHLQDEFEGTGVGLAIAQRIIHKHNGRIWALAEQDNGATFFFSFP